MPDRRRARSWRHLGGDFAFDLRHVRERLVPARLQFVGHQSVGRIGGVVLPEGAIGCKARRFKIAAKCFAHLIPPLVGLFLGGEGRRNSAGADHGEQRFLNGVIDPQTAKGDGVFRDGKASNFTLSPEYCVSTAPSGRGLTRPK